MPQDLLNPIQPVSSPLERLETAVDAMTEAQVQNTDILKGIEPVMEALITSYVQGTQEIKSAIESIEQYVSEIEPVKVNQEAVAAIGKLQKTFANPNLFKVPQAQVIAESKETVKAIRDLIKTLDLKPLEVNVENDFTKIEKALEKLQKLVKVEIPVEDGRVKVKLSDADLKKLGEGFSFPISVGTASEETLKLIQTQLNKLTFVDGVLQTTAGSGGGTSDGIIRDGVTTTIKATVLDKINSNPLATAIVDLNGDQISSFGGGVQYIEGDTDATITGTALLWEDTADTLRAASAAKPLPVQVISGVTTGLTDTQLRAAPVSVSGSFYQATQPVSAAALPLPTGAATESTLSSLNTKVTTVNTGAVVISSSVLPSGASTAAKQPSLGVAGTPSADVLTVQGAASMTAIKVDGSAVTQPVSGAFWQATQPVSLASVPSHAVTNAGTFATQSTLQAGSALVGKVGIDQTTVGTTNGVSVAQIGTTTVSTGNGVVGAGVQRVAIASDNTPFATKIDQTTLGTTNGVTPVAATIGGATPYKLISAATTNATSVKGSAGQIYSITGFNINAAVRYLKIYDKATAPTVGTDVPKHVYPMPGSTTGGGFTLSIPVGQIYTAGIAIAITTGIADTDTGAVAANEIVINLDYK